MLAEPFIPEPPDTVLRIANLEFRPVELQVLADDRRVGFTIREFELCFLLSQRLDAVVQRPEIYTEIWGGEMPSRNRSVDVLVRKVRAKLEQAAPGWRYVHTHFGVGYRFMPERASGEASKTTPGSKAVRTGSAA
jgi:DNA-binding response OmpR family regulator